jgi:hypothetical protein
MTRSLLFALAMIVAGAAAAEKPPAPPADPKAPAAPSAYRSAFENYRPFAHPEVVPWRRANEEVGTLGGHKGHMQPRDDKVPATPHGEHHK